MNNKKHKLVTIGLIGGGIMLLSIQFFTTSCSRPTTLNRYNWDGTNWSGYISGSLTLKDLGNKQAEIESQNDYQANNLVIPKQVVKDGVIYKIISIGTNAFYACTTLTGSLTFSTGLTNISTDAFAGCSNLVGSLTVSDSVTSIGERSFYMCTGLTGSLTIGNSVMNIGGDAFNGCSNITGSLIIPNSVNSIGNKAFYYCSGLTGSLTIGNSVTSMGNDAFWGCSGLTGSLTIGNNITSIGDRAFGQCTNFTGDLTIPNSVTSVGYEAFLFDSKFTSLIFNGFQNNPSWIGTGIFAMWNTSGGVVTTTGNFTSTWTSANALAYAISKGLNSSWHN